MSNQPSNTGADATAVKPHHEGPARVWGLAGRNYDDISFGVADALGHAVQRLNPGPAQEILDIATGTGWTARSVARLGAHVTAVDIASELLHAARELSSHVKPEITFRQADAEALPFADASFDGVISTFGVMFAVDQKQAARELGRVCRPGGRLSLVVWEPGGSVQDFFGVIGDYDTAPAPETSPLAWGDPDHARELLGNDFELWFEPGVNHHYFDSVDDAWSWYARGFGPIKQVIDQLSSDQQRAFKDAMDRYHRKFETDAGLHIRREYLVIVGRRM